LCGVNYPGLGYFLPFRFARIRPETGRQSHCLGERVWFGGRWYKVSREAMIALLKEPAHETRGGREFDPLFEFSVGDVEMLRRTLTEGVVR
jgi:hypothetical protein